MGSVPDLILSHDLYALDRLSHSPNRKLVEWSLMMPFEVPTRKVLLLGNAATPHYIRPNDSILSYVLFAPSLP